MNTLRKRCLINLAEYIKQNQIDITNIFNNYDPDRLGYITISNFRIGLLKINKKLSNQEIDIISNIYCVKSPTTFKNTGYVYHLDFIASINKIIQNLRILDSVFKRLAEVFEKGEIGLFQFFENADADGNGYLTRDEFTKVLSDFSINITSEELNDIIQCLDDSNDSRISYNELESALKRYMIANGLDLDGIKTRYAYRKLNEYWAVEIFTTIIAYIEGIQSNVVDYFYGYGMDQDLTMLHSRFSKAIYNAIPDLSQEHHKKLVSEFNDPKRHCIQIFRFKEIYDYVSVHISEVINKIQKPNVVGEKYKRTDAFLLEIVKHCVLRNIDLEMWFGQYGMDMFGHVMDLKKFQQALTNLNFKFDIEQLKACLDILDPRRTNSVKLNRLIEIKNEFKNNSMNNQVVLVREKYQPSGLSDSEKRILDDFFERFVYITEKNKIRFDYDFLMHDYKEDGFVQIQYFLKVMNDKKIEISKIEMNMILKLFCDIKGEFINYKKFLKEALATRPDLDEIEDNKARIILKPELQREKLKLLYNLIKSKFKTIEEFIIENTQAHNVIMEYEEFTSVMIKYKILESEDGSEGFYRMLTGDRYSLDSSNLRQALKPLFEVEAKIILQTVLKPFADKRLSLFSALEEHLKDSDMVNMFHVLKSFNSVAEFSIKDMLFILAWMEIIPNSKNEISFNIMETILKKYCKELRVLNSLEIDIVFTEAFAAIQQIKNPSKSIHPLSQELVRLFRIHQRSDIQNIYKQMDIHKTGSVDYEHFKNIITLYSKTIDDNKISEYFTHLSRDKSRLEFYDFFDVLVNPMSHSISPRQARESSQSTSHAKSGSRTRESSIGQGQIVSKSLGLLGQLGNDDKPGSLVSFITSDILQKMSWASTLLEEIAKIFESKGIHSDYFFDTIDDYMPVTDFRLKLYELRITDHDISRLAADLTTEHSPLLIDLRLFRICINHSNDLLRLKNFQTTSEVLFQKIAYTLMSKKRTFESVFNQYDYRKVDKLNPRTFELALQNELQLKLSQGELKILENKLKDPDGNISLAKLKQELGLLAQNFKESVYLGNVNRAQKILRDLRYILRARRLSPQQIFSQFDADKNEFLEFNEFQKIIQTINNFIAKNDIIALFSVFDDNLDGKIDTAEFLSQLDLSIQDDIPVEVAVIFLEDIKQKAKDIRPHEQVQITKILNTEVQTGIKLPAFEIFVRYLVKTASESHIVGMFHYLDVDKTESLEYKEFCKYFGLNPVTNWTNHQEWLIYHIKYFRRVFQNLSGLLILKQKRFKDFIDQKGLMPIENFKARLLSVELRLSSADIFGLCSVLGDKTDFNMINLTDLAFTYYYFNIEEDPNSHQINVQNGIDYGSDPQIKDIFTRLLNYLAINQLAIDEFFKLNGLGIDGTLTTYTFFKSVRIFYQALDETQERLLEDAFCDNTKLRIIYSKIKAYYIELRQKINDEETKAKLAHKRVNEILWNIYINIEKKGLTVAKFLENYNFDKIKMLIHLNELKKVLKKLNLNLNFNDYKILNSILDPSLTSILDFKFINEWKRYLNNKLDYSNKIELIDLDACKAQVQLYDMPSE